MQQYINTLFQQKIQEGFVEKELVKECAKNYKHEFPNGGYPGSKDMQFIWVYKKAKHILPLLGR